MSTEAGMPAGYSEAMTADPVAANLASLNELVAEMVQALADHGVGDAEFARMARATLRDHSRSLGFDFQGSAPRPAS